MTWEVACLDTTGNVVVGAAVRLLSADAAHADELATGTSDANGKTYHTLPRECPFVVEINGVVQQDGSSNDIIYNQAPVRGAVPYRLTGAEVLAAAGRVNAAGGTLWLPGGTYVGVNVLLD